MKNVELNTPDLHAILKIKGQFVLQVQVLSNNGHKDSISELETLS